MENKSNKVLVGVLAILLLIAVGAGVFFYTKYSDLKNKTNDNTNQVDNNNNQSNEGQTNKPVTKELLSYESGKAIYDKAIVDEIFVHYLSDDGYLRNSNFDDRQILVMLTVLSSESFGYLTCQTPVIEHGCFGTSATVEDVQRLAQKYFGRKIDETKAVKDTDGKIIADTPSGFGILNGKFVETYKYSDGTYTIKFETYTLEEKRGEFILTISYNESTGALQYKKIEKLS